MNQLVLWARRDRVQRALIWVVLPLLVYTVIALIITWPLVSQIDTHAAGAGYSDTYEGVRGAWWMREALLDGKNPYDQTLLVYPRGFTSWLQWAHPLGYLPPALLSLVVSPLVAYNLLLLIALVLNGLTAYWLGLELTKAACGGPLKASWQLPAALIGGTVFMAFPTMQGHLVAGHLTLLEQFALPLLVICLWRIVYEAAGWCTVRWGALWLALTALAHVSESVYVLLPLFLFAGVYLLLADRRHLFRPDLPLRDQPWLKLIVLVLVGVILTLPFLAPLAFKGGQAELNDVAETGRIRYSTDPLAFVSPSPFGMLKDSAPEYTRTVLGTNSTEGAAYLGLIPLGLVLLALFGHDTRRDTGRLIRLWLVILLGAMLFSLGPYLKWHDQPLSFTVEGVVSHIPMPWALFQSLPVVDSTRTPGRINLLTALSLSILVSVGASILLRKVRLNLARWGLGAALIGIILVEYQLFWPFLTVDARLPRYFSDLAQADDVRAVLNIPVENNLVAKIGLYQQVFHHQPLIAGHTYRRTPQDPALLAVLDQAATADDPQIRREDVPYLLSVAGADRVIVHKQYLDNPGAVVDRLRSILGAPEFEDDRWAAFVVPRVDAPPAGFTLAGAIIPGESWSPRVDLGSFIGSFLADKGDWYLYTDQERQGELVFPAASYRTTRKIGVWLDDHLIAGLWAGEGDLHLPLILSPGFHTLHFAAVNGCTNYPFALTCLPSSDLSADCQPLDPPACLSVAFGPPTWIAADPPLTSVDVRLADGLRLTAYQITVDQPGRVVHVRLFWQGDHRLSENYALFVHVADPQTSVPLAQYSDYPAFLTTDWGDHSRWVSDVSITLPADLPAGTYAINVGWFLPNSNKRLPVLSDQPGADVAMIFLETVALK